MQLSLNQSPNNEGLRDRFVDLMKEYRELSENSLFDFHRRLDRLNFLIFEINRQSERKDGFELAQKMSGRSVKHTLIFWLVILVIYGVAKVLGYLDVWNPHETSDYAFAGVLFIISFAWLGFQNQRFELEIDRSIIQLASMRDEWSLCCGQWLDYSEFGLLNEERHWPVAEDEQDAYFEKQERLNIRTLESLTGKVRHISGIAEEN